MEKRYADTFIWIYAVLNWVAALMLLIGGIALVFFTPLIVEAIRSDPSSAEWPPGFIDSFANGVGIGIGAFLIVLSILCVIVGIGLVKRKNWARIITIVFSVFDLFSFPIGTLIGAFGIYLFGFDDEVVSQFKPETAVTAPARRTPARKAAAKKKK